MNNMADLGVCSFGQPLLSVPIIPLLCSVFHACSQKSTPSSLTHPPLSKYTRWLTHDELHPHVQ